ncbi:hypothetical protein, partial [Mycolicibacterium austroafricanum]|uniref:hypothetical protein n=1 Tax=Mycolicibacterium austroafricanum TaxID=39687 RepID=UPI00197BBB69
VVVIPPQTKSKNTRFTDNGTGTPDGIATPQINGCCTDRMNPPAESTAWNAISAESSAGE